MGHEIVQVRLRVPEELARRLREGRSTLSAGIIRNVETGEIEAHVPRETQSPVDSLSNAVLTAIDETANIVKRKPLIAAAVVGLGLAALSVTVVAALSR